MKRRFSKFILSLWSAILLVAAPSYADIIIKNASTSKIFTVFVNDSSVTTGAGKTGLAFDTASLVCYYYEDGAGTGATSITLASSTLGTYTSGCFKEIDATNMPGWYEFCPPNAALDGGAGKTVAFECKGASNMAPMNLRVQLSPAVEVASMQTDTVNAAAVAADALTADVFAADGTAQSCTSTTIQLASAETYADSKPNGREVCIVAGTGKGQCREILSYTGATDTATISTGSTAWATTCDNTSKYILGSLAKFSSIAVSGTVSANVVQWNSASVASPHTAGYPICTIKDGTGIGEIDTNAGAVVSVTTTGTATNLTNLPSIPANWITAAGTAADFIAEVKTQVTDALNVDTYAELASVPGASPTVIQMLQWAYQMMRFKITQTSTTGTLFKADSSTSLGTNTVSDDGTTFTRGKFN